MHSALPPREHHWKHQRNEKNYESFQTVDPIKSVKSSTGRLERKWGPHSQLSLKVSTFSTPLSRAEIQELSQMTPELNSACPNLKSDGDLGLNSLQCSTQEAVWEHERALTYIYITYNSHCSDVLDIALGGGAGWVFCYVLFVVLFVSWRKQEFNTLYRKQWLGHWWLKHSSRNKKPRFQIHVCPK